MIKGFEGKTVADVIANFFGKNRYGEQWRTGTAADCMRDAINDSLYQRGYHVTNPNGEKIEITSDMIETDTDAVICLIADIYANKGTEYVWANGEAQKLT